MHTRQFEKQVAEISSNLQSIILLYRRSSISVNIVLLCSLSLKQHIEKNRAKINQSSRISLFVFAHLLVTNISQNIEYWKLLC